MKKLTKDKLDWLMKNYPHYYDADLAKMLNVTITAIRYHAYTKDMGDKDPDIMRDAHIRGAQITNLKRYSK